MTIKEFEEAVKSGKKYVVLDEYVLDLESFLPYHPGGKFVLKHNIGQDVSKFFHGGYSLEGNMGPRPALGHKHTNQARKIVNKLIIARLDATTEVSSTICMVDNALTTAVNLTTNAFFLKSRDGRTVPNFRRFFPGTKMLGKHFTIRTLTGLKPTRHYTICNVMQPKVYSCLVNMLTARSQSQTPAQMLQNIRDDKQLAEMLTTDDQTSMMFVIKNYKQHTGLSEKFFGTDLKVDGPIVVNDSAKDGYSRVPATSRTDDSELKATGRSMVKDEYSRANEGFECDFEVKGPMGKSLNVHTDGLHFAFAAGTGILPFMDLVAQVALLTLGFTELLGQEGRLTDDFKLRLYVSFQSKKDAIGLELLEALDRFCKHHGKSNFELVMRLSDAGKQRRWDADFIREQVRVAESLRRAWVCGPPVMTETFDRTFSAMIEAEPERFALGVLEVL